jgi:hypothetical protein
VAAGGGDFERALGLRLTLDLGEVGIFRRGADGCAGEGGERLLSGQVGADIEQAVRRQDVGRRHQRGFGGARGRQHEAATRGGGGQAHRQRTAYRPQFAAKRKLAGEFVLLQAFRLELPGGDEYAQRDGQVKPDSRQVGRRQVDGDAALREFETAVLDRRAYAVAGFLDLGVGQADQRKRRQAGGEMHLDDHFRRFHAGQRARFEDGQCHDE